MDAEGIRRGFAMQMDVGNPLAGAQSILQADEAVIALVFDFGEEQGDVNFYDFFGHGGVLQYLPRRTRSAQRVLREEKKCIAYSVLRNAFHYGIRNTKYAAFLCSPWCKNQLCKI